MNDVIVIGASHGGLNPLTQIVGTFPADLAAIVCVVVHIPAFRPSQLPKILNAAGALSVRHPTNLEPLQPGHIYVAPPDHHLMVDEGRALVWYGPQEDRHRPSINVLFRSAAVMASSRVVGVVLSGALDDGAAGLWWIKRHGGIAIVQHPADAVCAEMPNAALSTVAVDAVLPAPMIGHRVVQLVQPTERRAGRVEDGRGSDRGPGNGGSTKCETDVRYRYANR